MTILHAFTPHAEHTIVPFRVWQEPSVTMEVNCDECLGRCMSGSSCIMASYKNGANDAAVVGLTPNFPAKVIPLSLTPAAGAVRCKEGAYFASTGSVSIGYDFDFNPATCCFGGQGCVRQKVEGDGTAFLAAMGTLMTKGVRAVEGSKDWTCMKLPAPD